MKYCVIRKCYHDGRLYEAGETVSLDILPQDAPHHFECLEVPPAPVEPSGEDTPSPEAFLGAMTKAELLAFAEEHGIELGEASKVAEMRAVILAAIDESPEAQGAADDTGTADA